MRKIQIRSIVLVLLLQFLLPLSFSQSVSAQTSGSSENRANFAAKIKRIEEFAAKQMRSEKAVGLTIGFIKDDFKWVKGFGYADLENKLPAKPESSYRMASVTKPMTAIGILKLVEDGKIDLDAEVQKYVPYFPKKPYPITIRQLLGHLGGISHYKNYDLEGHIKEHKNTRESIAIFADFDLVQKPGTYYNYSSYGFNLLGAAIEGASGMPYGEYMTENVWKPLGMNDTLMDDPLQIIPNRVKGYQLIGGEIRNSEFVDISSRFGGGGTRSTVPDMLNMAEGLYKGKILSDKMRSEMWTSQYTIDGQNIGYGYGWGTNTANGRFVVGHGGSQQEAKTYVLTVPHQKFAAAVAINSENANPAAYVTKIFEIILDEPWSIRMFASDPKNADTLRAMDSAFDLGMRYLDQFGKPQTDAADELASSFAYFNDALKLPAEDSRRKLLLGNRLSAGEPFVKMVSFMADTLRKSGKSIDNYYDQGAILLFHDYIGLYRSQSGFPTGLKFSKEFEALAEKLNTDWAITWNEKTRDLDISADSDLNSIRKELGAMFAGRTVYPDLANEFDDLAVSFAEAGDLERSYEAAQTNYALYPGSDKANATLATLYIVSGKTELALPLFKKSLEINPRGEASAASLNGTAYALLGLGLTDGGLSLLRAAIELHPKDPNLYYSAAEFCVKLKQNENAINYYKKALETDPNFPDAKRATEMIAKLQK
ncbi:MAG: serine hydrolase [Acidobacteria bacterium]|nr:serine hydrolase [Acidobacteriota bacterium]